MKLDTQSDVGFRAETLTITPEVLGLVAELDEFKGDLPELSIQILELCRERGRVTISEIAKVTGVSRNTIKAHVSALAEKGHLIRHGAGRGTWYSQV